MHIISVRTKIRLIFCRNQPKLKPYLRPDINNNSVKRNVKVTAKNHTPVGRIFHLKQVIQEKKLGLTPLQ